MRVLWLIIYNMLGVPAMWIGFRALSLFNSKVREGLKGRRDLFSELDRSLSSFGTSKKVLIHSSSLGEYQQSVPLADEFLKKGYSVIHTFFSPSGYRNCKINSERIAKSYLPFDSFSNSGKFLDKVMPEILVFMRYDLWYNLVYRSVKKNIRLVVANARFDEKDLTWKVPVVSSFKKTMYRMLNDVFVIDEHDYVNYKKTLEGYGPNIIRAGDSKFERVVRTSSEQKIDGILPEQLLKDRKIFVIGSSWKDDEDVIMPAIDKALNYHKELMTFLVPHEPKPSKISSIERSLEKYTGIKPIRFSDIENYSGENLVIVDKMGILSKLYSAAYVSYVGGGFRTGLHNVLEPAIFNMPIFFANRVKNSDEEEILEEAGCGIVVHDTRQFYRRFREILSSETLRNEIGEKCREVFRDSTGIAETIVNNIT